ncbi:MAG: ABC transporter permease subunit [Microbacteriaceae bacterium]|nr:ABC transporter permease subunit [Microbacteriaceae bacterium]
MDWLVANWPFVAELSLTHLGIVIVPLVIGSVVAVAAARTVSKRWIPLTTTALGAVYAIPSLALFVALPALIGTDFIGPTNVVIALSVYVIASMFFSARDAFNQVPQSTKTTATALGMSPAQLFLHVELPMAVPGIITGLRVVSASTVSMASIGAIVGVRNLGYLFVDGFQRRIPEEIITGIGAVFAIALAFDFGLWLVGRVLTPWRARGDARV